MKSLGVYKLIACTKPTRQYQSYTTLWRVCLHLDLSDVRTASAVESVRRCTNPDGSRTAVVLTAAGQEERYDTIVFATHANATLAILGADATNEERAVLGAVLYQQSDVYVHTDECLMPQSRKVVSVNYSDMKSSSERDCGSFNIMT